VNNHDDPLSSRYWRKRALEAREVAKEAGDPQAEAAMLRVAHMYDELAERAEARESGAKVID
jgi:hypothetical protein